MVRLWWKVPRWKRFLRRRQPPRSRLQKCRLYEMTDNKTARSTIAYLIVRDQAHENAYAQALETLGVNWNVALPIPKTSSTVPSR